MVIFRSSGRPDQSTTPTIHDVSEIQPMGKPDSFPFADHLYSSGLRRIRQDRSPLSPVLQDDDFARFPSESLHSFSFALQNEESINSREEVLKKSLEFMAQGSKVHSTDISAASSLSKARASQDHDVLSMLELMSQANLVSQVSPSPMTGPANVETNAFDDVIAPPPSAIDTSIPFSEQSSRSTTRESHDTSTTTPPTPPTRKSSLRRTYTDISPVALQAKLIEALSKPYNAQLCTTLHATSHRFAPNPQAVFTTEACYPWTILAANDMACLVFGVTKDEVRKIGILEVVKEDRRDWLASKLPKARSASRAKDHHRSQTQTSQREKQFNKGVLLCGDVVPIKKRNGELGAASLWVKEKRQGLIWVLEEIKEDIVQLREEMGKITHVEGDAEALFDRKVIAYETEVSSVLPSVPLRDGYLDLTRIENEKYYTARTSQNADVPCIVEVNNGALRVCSFPHIAGILVLSAKSLKITSSNAVFSAALFGLDDLTDVLIDSILPNFSALLSWLQREDSVVFSDGLVVPEHSFRRAQAVTTMQSPHSGAAMAFLRPTGLDAKHRDGAVMKVDVQMKVVGKSEGECVDPGLMYALWITYTRNVHAADHSNGAAAFPSPTSPRRDASEKVDSAPRQEKKKSLKDFIILESMGQGAYGQVKLARNRTTGENAVIKYVVKKKILVDTWARDRKLGTIPLEIHVLNFLKSHHHPNIMEMRDYFEDSLNYYIEMAPHGLPGMDLFDYIELRVNMDEAEVRSIFMQVAFAIQHLHACGVVHRDIKDENVVLDGDGNVKLIDFGSAAYAKDGLFDVFVGTIDYAAPEVLAGQKYEGRKQDVWAAGILLYTMIYKENPFYNVDEIMDRDLRIPFVMSADSIGLIQSMLNRAVDQRPTVDQVLQHSWFSDGIVGKA